MHFSEVQGVPKKATQSEPLPISTVFVLTSKSLHPMVEETWEIDLNGKWIVKTKLFCTEKMIEWGDQKMSIRLLIRCACLIEQ